jgi:hypothetical protein
MMTDNIAGESYFQEVKWFALNFSKDKSSQKWAQYFTAIERAMALVNFDLGIYTKANNEKGKSNCLYALEKFEKLIRI